MNVEVPFAIVTSLISGAFAFGAAWTTIRGKVTALEKRLDRAETRGDASAEAIQACAVALKEAATRISDISELKTTAVRADTFRIRMDAQDDSLKELRIAVDRKQSVSTMPVTPPPMPVMRPRAPSRPGR